jgi:hypothetical protein
MRVMLQRLQLRPMSTFDSEHVEQALGRLDMTVLGSHSERRPAPWLALAVWLCLLCALGAAYVSSVVKDPRLFLVALVVAALATLAFGAQVGHRSDWRTLRIGGVIGASVLLASVEAGWVATFFVPLPGGSGGVGDIVAPVFLAVIFAVPSAGIMAILLGIGAGAGVLFKRISSQGRARTT